MCAVFDSILFAGNALGLAPVLYNTRWNAVSETG